MSEPENDTVTPRRPGPKPGNQPRGEILFEAMAVLKVGETISWEQMGDLLGLDPANPKQRPAISVAAKRACALLTERERKIARLVWGQGYQIADSDTVMVLAHRHQSRALAEVEAGRAKVNTIDLGKLDATTAKIVEATAMGFERQAEYMGRIDIRQQRIERVMGALAERVDDTASRVEKTSTKTDDNAEEITRIRERLAQLESGRP
jgi:hypothetical protein